MDRREAMEQALENIDESDQKDMVTLDGLDDAMIAIEDFGNGPVVVYDYNSCLAIFAEQFKDVPEGDDPEEYDPWQVAIEWMEFNTVRALPYMGKQAPVIISLFSGLNVVAEEGGGGGCPNYFVRGGDHLKCLRKLNHEGLCVCDNVTWTATRRVTTLQTLPDDKTIPLKKNKSGEVKL